MTKSNSYETRSSVVCLEKNHVDNKYLYDKRVWRLYLQEAKALCHLGFPIALSNVLMNCLLATLTVTTGHLKKVELDAISLSQSFFIGYGMALIIGLSTACDTLFSQTIGSRDKKRTGMWLQKGLLIINAIAVVLCAIHLNMEPVFLLIGQFPEVARLASSSSAYMAPALIIFANFQVLLRYLQNQGIIYVPVLIMFIGFVFNAGFQYLLIFQFDFGYTSAAVVQTFSFGLMLSLTVAYMLIWKKYQDTWDGLKRESLTLWWKFTLLALCGTGHYAFESFCLNLGIIMTGTISETLLAAQSILYMIGGTMFTIPYTLSVTLNIRIGQNLGQLNAAGAKRTLKTGLIIAASINVVTTIFIESTARLLPKIFTHHTDIIEVTSRTLPFVMLCYIFDTFRGCTDGALRGCGRQAVGAIIITVVFSLIAVPMAVCLLLYSNLRLIGYWIGTATGVSITFFGGLLFLLCLDWNKEAVNAQERVLKAYKSKQPIDEKSLLLPQRNSLRKHLRQPTSSTADLEDMMCHADVTDSDFRRLCLLRGLTIVGCLLLLLAAIVVHSTLPRDFYVTLGRNVTSA